MLFAPLEAISSRITARGPVRFGREFFRALFRPHLSFSPDR
jgi:hypothetical protein